MQFDTNWCKIRHALKIPLSTLQLADAKDVIEAIQSVEGARFPVLTPNLKVSYLFSMNILLQHF